MLQGNNRLLSKMIIKIKREAIMGIKRKDVRKREKGIKVKIELLGVRVKMKVKVKEMKRTRISIKIFLISWKPR